MKQMVYTVLDNKIIVPLLLVIVLIAGVMQYRTLQTDAFPDISPVMVPIFAEAHGMAPEEVERLIVYPIESAMNGLPGIAQVKSTSAFGMGVVYVYFNDDVNIYFARQIVAERMNSAMAQLPDLHEPPVLGPISTGLGEVFMYYLRADSTVQTGGKEVNTYLREVNDYIVKYQLQTVKGVTEILSMGGHVLQYTIETDPFALRKYSISLDDIITAVNDNNRNAGGQFLVLGSEEYLVRGVGILSSLDDLKSLQVKVHRGVAVRLGDIAAISYGKEVRRGVVTLNGEEEAVAGIVMKLYGANTSEVIDALNDKFISVKKNLPQGVSLVPYYSQSTLVKKATATVTTALMQGALLVFFVLLLFLGDFGSAVIVGLALPVCAAIAVILMKQFGMSANLMSLGGIAIAIGMLGDASIVVVENIHRHLGLSSSHHHRKSKSIAHAVREVLRPIAFSVIIIIIVFLPLYTLQGIERKMFAPMASTVTFALVGSLVAAFLFAPALSALVLKQKTGKEYVLTALMKKAYYPVVTAAQKFSVVVALAAVALLGASLLLVPRLGTEFIPTLEEGIIQINVVMAPSISLEKATETIMKIEREIRSFPEVNQTLGKIGRPEAGSHPHPVNSAHIQLTLKEPKAGDHFRSKEKLIFDLSMHLREFPGVQCNFSQPIQNMFDELLSGVKTQLAIRIFGDNLDTLRTKAEAIQQAITGVAGLVDVATDQNFGQPQVQITADRSACARYGVTVADIMNVVELAIGGEVIDNVFVNTRRIGIFLRFREAYRNTPEAIKQILIRGNDGVMVPLERVATVKTVIGPVQINREKNQRRWVVSANIRGRDMGSVVAEIRERIEERIQKTPGYSIDIGGQFENQQRAMKRLTIIVPIALLLIGLMLYFALGSFRGAFLIFINIPLALIGGIAGLYFSGEYLSVPASVGFIALFGIAVQNGLVLVTYINQLRKDGRNVRDAVTEACILRLRPVLMTALTTILGIAPLLFSSGIGSEVQRPLAIVVVFGLVSSTVLNLIVIPACYGWFYRDEGDKKKHHT